MKRWILWAARLYPRAWRERYGEEFEALLGQVNPGWRELADVTGGALKMQFTNGLTYLKWAGALAVTGALMAAAVSFAMPKRYVSTAVVGISMRRDAGRLIPQNALDDYLAEETAESVNGLLSRPSLAEIIVDPSLDVYRAERTRRPMEEIVQEMRSHVDVRRVSGGTESQLLRISFDYPEGDKAQAIVRQLTVNLSASLISANRRATGMRHLDWAGGQTTVGPRIPGAMLTVLERPTAAKSTAPNRLAYILSGLGLGLLAGLAAAAIRKQPRRVLTSAVCALAGCAAGLAVSFTIPNAYVSTAVMRFDGPPDNGAEALSRMQAEVLSDESLERIARHPELDLYRNAKPMPQIIDRMRQAIQIRTVSPTGRALTFSISFRYTDPVKAKLTVSTLVKTFIDYNVQTRSSAELLQLDPPSYPMKPLAPNRLSWSLAGVLVGLLGGWLWSRRASPDLVVRPAQ